ncbi:MAG: hypothetical protein KDN05_00425 [Verrucomicrobiae bacterium]|nr:hypothetical protein [Verrucomicrobiae bacterium]
MKSLRRLRSLLGISFSTLRHEWLPSTCLMMALAAVLCPVILILGLKHGTVENLRQSLLRDPSNLEIRPRMSLQVDDKLVRKIRSMKGVGFLVPKTRSLGSASVEFGLSGTKVDVDLLPTAQGDPLLAVYQCEQPGFQEAVLTRAAAVSLSADVGAEILMILSRRSGDGRAETVSLPMKVRGVLPQEATTIRAAYVQLPLLSAVEEYRENLAVPRLGWKGPESQFAAPIFDGFLVASSAPILPETISRLSVATGFLSHRRIDLDDRDQKLARRCRESRDTILFFNDNNPRPIAAIEAASGIVDANLCAISPWVRPIDVRVEIPGGEEKLQRLYTLTDSTPRSLPDDGIPWIEVSNVTAGMPEASLYRTSPVGECLIPCRLVRPDSALPEGIGYADASFTGILRHLDDRNLQWDTTNRKFLLGRRSFSSFRLYADGLTSVSKVSANLATIGIDCSSEAAKVARVLKFDKDLSILFWLVTAFSLAGGGAALALSLYGAIERRKRDYAMLRTLGLPRLWLVLLPLIEAITVTIGSFIIAMLIYHLNAAIINRLFSQLDDDRPGFCSLTPKLQVLVLVCSLGLAVLGALAAATRLISISPSKAIRHA